MNAIGRECHILLRLAGPLVASQLLQVGMSFIDIVMIGRLGAGPLAAGGLGGTLWSFMLVISMGLLMALSPVVAQLKGAGQEEKVAQVFHQGIWLALGIGFGAMMLTRSVSDILFVFEIPQDVIPLTEAYLNAVSWGMPAACLYFVGRFVIEGIGYTRPAMIIHIIALLVNALANYILIYGKWGAPALGVAGAGWASCLVLYLNAVLMFLYLSKSAVFKALKLFSAFSRPLVIEIVHLLKVSIPIAFMLMMELGLFATVALLMGRFGTNAVGAHQLALNYAALMYMVPLGISLALTVRVGHAVGEKAYSQIRFRGAVGMGVAIVFMLISAIIILLFPEAIISIYTEDMNVREIAVRLLFMAALFQLSDGLQVSATGVLRGMQDTTVPMLMSVAAYWLIGFPSAWLTGVHFGLGPVGLWLGLIAGLTFAALLAMVRFYRLTRGFVLVGDLNIKAFKVE